MQSWHTRTHLRVDRRYMHCQLSKYEKTKYKELMKEICKHMVELEHEYYSELS